MFRDPATHANVLFSYSNYIKWPRAARKGPFWGWNVRLSYGKWSIFNRVCGSDHKLRISDYKTWFSDHKTDSAESEWPFSDNKAGILLFVEPATHANVLFSWRNKGTIRPLWYPEFVIFVIQVLKNDFRLARLDIDLSQNTTRYF